MADASEVATIDRRSEALKDPKSVVKYWLAQLRAAKKQEEDWRKDADDAVERFNGKKGKTAAFNILHSNVATIAPAVYNSKPIPDIRPRHQPPPPTLAEQNPEIYQQRAMAYEVARRGGQLQEAALNYGLDEYDFDSVIKATVQDNNVVGRGVDRVRYNAIKRTDKDAGETIVWQEAYCEHVPWRHFLRGPGSTWDEVPWIAFERFYDLDGLDELCKGEGINTEAIPRDHTDELGGEDKDKTGEELTAFKKAAVWEIWSRDKREVLFISEGYKEKPLKTVEDPLGLKNFYPIPRPLQAIADPDNMTPTVPFELYKRSALELEEVSNRILANVKMLKVRGIRASELKELEDVFNLDDGQFLASEGALTLLTGGQARGLDAAMWMVPIDQVIVVVRELVLQRAEILQQIYELTGIADIMRGRTKASETLGAQQIKANWGSLRVQDQQKEVERYCRDILRLKAEIIGNKFKKETLQLMVGDVVPDEVIKLLRSDIHRSYLIDVETDSTIRADLTRNQEQMAQFMTGTAQFWQVFMPLLESGKMPRVVASTAVTIYSAFARQFRLGKQVEDALSEAEMAAQQMVESGPEVDPAEMQQLQQQLQQIQEQAQQLQQENAVMKADRAVETEKVKIQQFEAETDRMAAVAKIEESNRPQQPERDPELERREMDLREREMDTKEAETGIRALEVNANARQAGLGQQVKVNPRIEGKMPKTKPRPPDNVEKMILDGLRQLGDGIAQLSAKQDQLIQIFSAPVEIVRDDTGRATGAQRVFDGARTVN